MSETKDLHWHRRNNPKLIAMNMAYGILIEHSAAFAENIPLDGLADDIAAAILKGAVPEESQADGQSGQQ
jgi:hypothetical protein